MPVFLLIRPFSSSGYSLSLQLSLYKNVIDRADCIFEVFIADTDDNIQLTGSLVDHLDINVCVSKCREDSSCCSSCRLHSTTYDRDQCKIRLKLNVIRIYRFVNSCKNLLFLSLWTKIVIVSIPDGMCSIETPLSSNT